MASIARYTVAGHSFTIDNPSVWIHSEDMKSFENFYVSELPDSNCRFEVQLRQSLTQEEGVFCATFDWEDACCEIYDLPDGSSRVILTRSKDGISCQMHARDGWSKIVVEYDPHIKTGFGFFLNFFIMISYCFSTIAHQTMLLHASVVVDQERGFLFLGKSGTGKSTHSRMWLAHIKGAKLLNDDNPVIRLDENGDVWVYGSPWSGKTPCYLNEHYRVGAFVRIIQSDHNQMHSCLGVEAFMTVFPSCSNMRWNAEKQQILLQTISKLITRVKIATLECLPNGEAAEVCRKSLQKTI